MPTLARSAELAGPAMSPVRRQLRRRAMMDVGLALVAVGAATFIGSTPHDQLLAAVAMASLATIWFLVRRHQDMEAVRTERSRRMEAMRAHGISLADWKAGKALAPWDERAHSADGQS